MTQPQKIRHEVRLSGENARGAVLSGLLLHDLLEVLVLGSRAALRLRIEGRSTARGAPPVWLVAAAEFDFVGLTEGSTVAVLEATPLAAIKGEQLSLEGLSDPQAQQAVAGQTSLAVFEQSLVAATDEALDSPWID